MEQNYDLQNVAEGKRMRKPDRAILRSLGKVIAQQWTKTTTFDDDQRKAYLAPR